MALYGIVVKSMKDGQRLAIRSARAGDAPSLLDFLERVFNTSDFLLTEPDEYRPDLAKQERLLEEAEASAGSLVLLALVGEEIVGMLDLRTSPNRRRIAHRGTVGVSVDHAYRGRGVGRALLEAAIEWTKRPESSIEKLELGVLAENRGAVSLYESLGFEVEGVVRQEVRLSDGRSIDGLHMGLFLK